LNFWAGDFAPIHLKIAELLALLHIAKISYYSIPKPCSTYGRLIQRKFEPRSEAYSKQPIQKILPLNKNHLIF
jgi:hypothetical protein